MKLVRYALFPLLGLGLQAAVSEAVEIGRTSLEMPSGSWEVLTTYETQLKFKGYDGQHSIPMQNTAFQLPGTKDTPRALLIVTSTVHNNRGRVRWTSEVCPVPKPGYFTEHFGSNVRANIQQCLIVNSRFAPLAYFKPDSEVMKALNEKGLSLFKAGYSLRTVYGSDYGTLLRVHLLTQRDFKGLTGSAAAAQQSQDLAPELIKWGESLHTAVQESVQSLSGKLVLPPIHFKD